MSRRVCVVTGSRAEYGLLRWVMRTIADAKTLELQVVATGMHLSPTFGGTHREIEADGFSVDFAVDSLLSSNTPVGVAKSMGLGLIGFADALDHLKPDLLLVLGDRFEILPAVAASLVARVPVAHLHGGETTEGAFDESIRHAITKMSHLHFVATEQYRDRIIQMGENADAVHNVGALGVDGIVKQPALTKQQLEDDLGVKFREKNLLITLHPETLSGFSSLALLDELLVALGELDDTMLLFTKPNADVGSAEMFDRLDDFVSSRRDAYAFTSLGQHRYLSCMRLVDGVVGNTSSGVLEAPSIPVGTVNIGGRQDGRIMADSVICCTHERHSISQAIQVLYSPQFRKTLQSVVSPYGNGHAAEAITRVLESCSLDDLVRKRFFDLPVATGPMRAQPESTEEHR